METSDTVDTDDIKIVVGDEIRVLVTGTKMAGREGVARMLETQDAVDVDVVAVVDVGDALSEVGQTGAHVAVIRQDEATQLELCRQLTVREPPVGVVVADSFRSVQDFAEYREAGARGFVRADPPVAVTDAVRVVAAGREFRDPLIPDEPPNPHDLTDREMEVLSHLLPGCSNRDIAEQLHISEDTVKYHLKHIYGKLGVHSRDEAIAIALQEGIVEYRSPRRDT